MYVIYLPLYDVITSHFVNQDIECDEMHMYGDYVTKQIERLKNGKGAMDTDVRVFDGCEWSKSPIAVYAVRIGGSWRSKVGGNDQLDTTPVYGFAFCKVSCFPQIIGKTIINKYHKS